MSGIAALTTNWRDDGLIVSGIRWHQILLPGQGKMTEKTEIEAQAVRSEIEALTDAINRCEDRSKLGQLFVYRAQYETQLGDDVKAVEDYLDALEVTEEDSDVSRIKSAIALIFASKVDREQDALYWALGAVDRAPEDPEARYVLGLVLCHVQNLGLPWAARIATLGDNQGGLLRCKRSISFV